MQPLYLSHDQLERLPVTAHDVVAGIERVLRGRAEAKAWNAPKSVIQPPDGRYMMATLSASDDPPYLAVKALLLNPKNTARGLPGINSLVILLDSDTGRPLATMDGNWVTAVRTAGLSAVAASRLARPDSKVVAFIGTGVQAGSHLALFRQLYPLKQLRAFSRGAGRRDAFCRRAVESGLEAVASETARDAVAGADIVVTSVTLTPELTPFLDAGWLEPGAFVAMTDLARPWFPESIARFDRIVIDDLEQEAAMARPMVPADRVAGDLSGLVSGAVPGRQSDRERTAFTFRGLGLGDLALAALAYQRASGAV